MREWQNSIFFYDSFHRSSLLNSSPCWMCLGRCLSIVRFVIIEAGTWKDGVGLSNGKDKSKCSVVDKRKWWGGRLMVSWWEKPTWDRKMFWANWPSGILASIILEKGPCTFIVCSPTHAHACWVPTINNFKLTKSTFTTHHSPCISPTWTISTPPYIIYTPFRRWPTD